MGDAGVMRRTGQATRQSANRPPAGTGRVVMWRGGSAWVSRETGPVPPHAHHAIQVTLSPGGPIRIRDAATSSWSELRASIVMPDRPHAFDGCGREVVMLFVEPESTAGRALLARFGGASWSPIPDAPVLGHAGALLETFLQGGDDERLVSASRDIVELIAGGVATPLPLDSRIAAVVEWLQGRIEHPVSLSEAAAIAHLSPSRFRHLFVHQTGVSFRAYLLWSRVSRAIAKGMAGDTWTGAAQASGFADSAHLTRTCRRMFGIAPSMLARD